MTFGSFNNFAKVSDRTLALWGRVLEAVPNSRLLLKSYTTTDLAFHARLLRCGLDSKRVELLTPAASNAAHLRLYNEVDVALDTYPYHGTTTTCESFWQGVPAVALRGKIHAAKVSESLLHAVERERETRTSGETRGAAIARLLSQGGVPAQGSVSSRRPSSGPRRSDRRPVRSRAANP